MAQFRLSIIAVIVAFGLLIPAAAGAATRPAHSTSSHSSWALSIAGARTAQHKVERIALSPQHCAAVKRELARTGAAPLKHCMLGVGLVVGHPRPAPAPRQAHSAQTAGAATWYTNYVKATMCFGDSPIWGSKNSSFTCSEGYTDVAGDYEYNGVNAYEEWVSCGHWYLSSKSGSLTQTWCGVWNNGAKQPAGYMDFGVNDDFSGIAGLGNGSAWLRIDVYYWGLLQLRGGWEG